MRSHSQFVVFPLPFVFFIYSCDLYFAHFQSFFFFKAVLGCTRQKASMKRQIIKLCCSASRCTRFPSVPLCLQFLRACVTESTLNHFPATAIKHNDIQGPPSKFAVAMVTVSSFQQVILGNISLERYLYFTEVS